MNELETIILDVQNNTNNRSDIVKILVGNKSDRAQEREVTYQTAMKFMEANHFDLLIEVSSLSGFNIEFLFEQVARL